MKPLFTNSNANLAKIARPRVDGILLRTSLFSKLDSLRKNPVVWVAGPPGSGKTTLITSYIEANKLPCLWYQVDNDDDDPATFFYYLGLAGQKAAPHRDKAFPFFTPEYALGLREFSHGFFTALFNCLQPSCVLVFDNYQETAANSLLHDVLLEGSTCLPSGMNLFFVSRSAAPAGFARLKANRLMDSMSWRDLRLTEPEFQTILETQCGQKAPKKIMRAIYRRLDGWAAGLHLFLETADSAHFDVLHDMIEGPLEAIFDYFACEIFTHYDESARDFLFKTTLLPFATPEMANRVSGHSDGDAILATLNRKNHFIVRRTEPILSYQFHPLFQQFLQKRAEATYSRQDLIAIKRKAADILFESKQTERAAELLREAGDWEGFSALILNRASEFVNQGRNLRLASWIQLIPAAVRSETPWLIYWLAVARMPVAPQESQALFEKAFYRFKAEDDRVGLFLSWSGVADSITFGFTKFAEFDQWLEVFEEIKEKYTPYPSSEIEARMTVSVLKAMVLRQPFHQDYDRYFERVAEMVETDINMNARVQMFHTLCIAQIFEHNFIRAEFFIQSFKSYVNAAPVAPMARMLQLQTESLYAWLTARFDACENIVAKAFESGSEFGIHLLDHSFLSYLISAALSQGDVRGAQPLIRKMMACTDPMNDWAKGYFHHLMGWLNVLNGDWEQAMFHGNKGNQYAHAVGMPMPIGFGQILIAFIEHGRGNYRESDQWLAQGKTLFNRIGSESAKFSYYFFKAHIDFERGREQEGVAALTKCFTVGREYGCVNSFFWHSMVVAELCAKALERDIEIEYVRKLIRKRSLVPKSLLAAGKHWPWPIKIYTLGRFCLVINDRPFVSKGKAQRKPLAMLKVLIALKGREVKEEIISDALWPDADGDMAHHSFNSTLYRLRKLLGHKRILKMRDGKLSLNQHFCWVDAWVFERLLGKAEREPENKHYLIEKALRMYHGPFLAEDSDASWSIPMRERLRSKFLRNIGFLAQRWQREQEWEKAANVFNKGLEADHLAETFYQGLMRCHLKLGRRAEALSTYHRCRETLAHVLNIEPSAGTEAIYKSLSAR